MKDDKKKLVVLAGLVVVVLGVGVFQFTGMNQPAPAPTAKNESKPEEGSEGKTAKAEGDTTAGAESGAATGEPGAEATGTEAKEEDPMKQLYAMALPSRDPFQEGVLPNQEEEGTAAPTNTKINPPVNHTPRVNRGNRGPSIKMPPFNPMQGSLPPVGGDIQISPGGGAPVALPNDGYTVSGVMTGKKNSAVLSDSQGNQRLVTEGQQLDGDSKVVSVRKGQVVIKRKGKTITLNVGGNP